jgi:hypothetical protein
MPAAPPVNAMQHLSLADIDAALATFVDPLSPDEVVALAQWWTLRQFLTDQANLLTYEDLDLLIKCGYRRDGAYYARLKTELKPKFENLVELYKILPSRDDNILNAIYAAFDQLSDLKPARSQLIEIELLNQRYEAATLIGWRAPYSQNSDVVVALAKAGDWERVDEYVAILVLAITEPKILVDELVKLAQRLVEAGIHERAHTYLQQADSVFEQIPMEQKASPNLHTYWENTIERLMQALCGMGQVRRGIEVLVSADSYRKTSGIQSGIKYLRDEAEVIECLQLSMTKKPVRKLMIPLIERLLELGCRDTARHYLALLPRVSENPFADFAQQTAVFSPTEVDNLIERYKRHILNTTQPNSNHRSESWISFGRTLVELGFLDEAKVMYVAHPSGDHRINTWYHLAVLNYLAGKNAFTELIEQVQSWQQQPLPYTDEQDWQHFRVQLLVCGAAHICDFAPETAALWLEQANPKSQNNHLVQSVYVGLAGAYFQRCDFPAARAWLARCQPARILQECPRFVRLCLKKNDVKNARAFLQLILQARTQEYNTALNNVVREIDYVLANSLTMDTADQLTQPLPLVRDVAEPSSQNLPEFLNRLFQMTTLPPTMLQACLDVIAQFAPDWADLLENSAFEGIPA